MKGRKQGLRRLLFIKPVWRRFLSKAAGCHAFNGAVLAFGNMKDKDRPVWIICVQMMASLFTKMCKIQR